jgi:hypothetical protein
LTANGRKKAFVRNNLAGIAPLLPNGISKIVTTAVTIDGAAKTARFLGIAE